MRGECPCHGSMYDVRTGTSFLGPASLQAPPSNTLAQLDFEADSDGFMFISPPTWGVNQNGVVGYGRFHLKGVTAYSSSFTGFGMS